MRKWKKEMAEATEEELNYNEGKRRCVQDQLAKKCEEGGRELERLDERERDLIIS